MKLYHYPKASKEESVMQLGIYLAAWREILLFWLNNWVLLFLILKKITMPDTKTRTFADVINSNIPALVDFTAAWCGPCKMMPPILKEVKDNLKDSVTIIKVDIDKNREAAQAYNVQSVPTLILFQGGTIKWRQSGVIPAKQLQDAIEANIS